MAYDNIEQVTVGDVRKNSRGDYIRVQKCFNKNKGTSAVDVRDFYTSDDSEDLMPTKKGVRIQDENIADVVKYIYEAASVEAKGEIRQALEELFSKEDSESSENEEDDE